MKRIYKNTDIEFDLSKNNFNVDIDTVSLLSFTFFTLDKTNALHKSKEDIIEGKILLEWKDLGLLQQGVLHYCYSFAVQNSTASDDNTNDVKVITTNYFIMSGVEPVPEPVVKNDYYTKELMEAKLDTKQNLLVSGKNISTINGEDLTKGGNLVIEGSISDERLQDILNLKQDVLVSGENIKTINNNNILGKGDLQVGITEEHLKSELSKKLDILTNGINIASINGQDLTKGGNIIIEGGGSSLDFNKPMPNVSISGSWKYYNSTDLLVTGLSESINPTLEKGYKAVFTGTYKWTATGNSKRPTAVTSNSTFKDLPTESGVNSTTYTSSKITSNTTIKAEISAPKTGLMIKGNDVVAAEGIDTALSSVSVYFKDRVFKGNSDLNIINEEKLKSLASDLRSSRSQTVYNVNTRNDNSYYVYSYPSNYGNLTSIMLGTYEVLGAFSLTTVQLTNEAGLKINYNVYVSNKRGAFTNVTLKFN